ncbi:MAG: porin [Burkholderiales bacterium]|nr:porin [Burkholderiales bacterium]
MKLRALIPMLAMPLAISSAWAADDGPSITISGFGTAAVTHSNSEDADFIRPNQAAGSRDNYRTGVDSNFGIQATAKFNDMFSFTGQGLVRKYVTDSVGAELAWAFAKVRLSDHLNLRVGRVGLPVYMISDYRNVGYVQNMIRPPVEMYSQVPIDSVDGVDAVYQTSFGDTAVTAQLAFGKTKTDSAGGYTVDLNRLYSLNLVAEMEPFTFRFGHAGTRLSIDNNASLNAVVGGLSKFGFKSAADSLAVKDAKGTFTSLGFGLDWKNIVVQAEYGKRKTDSLTVADTTSWYTMAGYRIGKFLPYYNHASVRQNSPRTVAGVPTTGPFAALGIGANAIASTASIQTSNSLGVRWDFYKSAALKVQIDRFSPENGSGTFANAKPGFKGPVTVFAAGIDFVF